MAKRKIDNRILRGIICSAVCLAVFLGVVAFNRLLGDKTLDTDKSFVCMIDVAQGDSTLIYSKGYAALIDTGTEDNSGEVIDCLKSCGIEKLDALLITHLDSDHLGGIDDVTDSVDVDYLILPELSVESEGITLAELAINKVVSAGGETVTAKQGMNFSLGDFTITVLAQFSKLDSENNRSVITSAKIGDKRFLFTGDIEAKAERALIAENLDLKSDVLKVAHHGSSSSTISEFLDAVSPSYATISAGVNNRYGHPHSEVLSRLEKSCKEIYRTDLDGDITFYIDDNKIKVKTEK